MPSKSKSQLLDKIKKRTLQKKFYRNLKKTFKKPKGEELWKTFLGKN